MSVAWKGKLLTLYACRRCGASLTTAKASEGRPDLVGGPPEDVPTSAPVQN